ncbi:MAG: alpha/beta fold hydrolase [Chloroflexota bacterium]|nr:alpha/beta fold hydrolase [Chloroflexota bacterium]
MMLPSTTLMPGAEPFYFRGGAIGILCIHGFTANPSEMRWLGEYLATQGHTVCGVRLAGHGTHPYDLARTQWQDWYASALDGYHMLRDCERICVVGHSMGGLLGILLTAMMPVAALALLATPVHFPTRLGLARWLRYLRPFTDQSDTSTLQDMLRLEQVRRGESPTGRVRYDLWSTAAVHQLYTLSEVAHSYLPFVRAPLLAIYSRADKVVPFAQLDQIAERAGSRIIETCLLEHSGHILPQDSERETVFARVNAFFDHQTRPSAQ